MPAPVEPDAPEAAQKPVTRTNRMAGFSGGTLQGAATRHSQRWRGSRAPHGIEEFIKQCRAANRSCGPGHFGLTFLTVVLALLSMPIVLSATAAKDADHFFTKQIIFVVGGLALMFAVACIHPKHLPRAAFGLYLLTLVGLILTSFTPMGIRDPQGIQRWLNLKFITLQVSEFAKIAIIGMVAAHWSHCAWKERKSLKPWLAGWLWAGPLVLLVFFQPHGSAALLLFALPCFIAFFAGAPGLSMVKAIGGLAVVGVLALAGFAAIGKPLIKPYQMERILTFVDRHRTPDAARAKDFKDSNYQAEQGMNALRRGGWFGRGPGLSFFKHGYVPESHTDYIFAIIGEEWGLAGALGLLAGFGMMIFFCFNIAHSATTSFESLFCAGVGSLLALQVVANIGVVTGIFPVTGVVLPLVSYGGSGLVAMLIAIGAVLGISRRQCEVE